MKTRTLTTHVVKFLNEYKKMLFISGPRQAGKTTLSKNVQTQLGGGVYFSWDILTDRKKFTRNPYFFDEHNVKEGNVVILDEIHKYSKWKNYLKGVYDKYQDDFLFLVTGSGRLDIFKKGGDSLLGRYLSLPLFPFTYGELLERIPSFNDFKKCLDETNSTTGSERQIYDALYHFGGFPEPLLKTDDAFANIWRRERRDRLIKEDIRDVMNIRELSLLEMLSLLVVERVGNPLSINSLREDLGVAFETVRDWLQVLDRFYYLFTLNPYGGSLNRMIHKEKKTYLFDWSEIENEGVRFENMLALHLLKATKTWTSLGEGLFHVCYLRDKDKREVDFVVTANKKPVCLIEAKLTDARLSDALLFYQEKLKIPVVVQLVHQTGVETVTKKNGKTQWVVSADRWLGILP